MLDSTFQVLAGQVLLVYATALLLGSWNNFLGAYASKLKGAGFDFQVLAGHMLLVYALQRCYWARGIVFWVPLLRRVLDSTSKVLAGRVLLVYMLQHCYVLGSWNRLLGAYASLKGAGFEFQVLAGHVLLVYTPQCGYWAHGVDSGCLCFKGCWIRQVPAAGQVLLVYATVL